MDNNIACTAPEAKKKADVFAMVAGAILALGFLPVLFYQLPSFINGLETCYFYLMLMVTGNNLETLGYPSWQVRTVFSTTASCGFICLGLLIFITYSVLSVCLKGKKIRALFICGFVAVLLGNVCDAFNNIWLLLMNIRWIFGSMEMMRLIMRVMPGVLMCVAAIMGIICGMFNKKGPSVTFGILGSVSALSAFAASIGFRILEVVGFGYAMNISLLLSMAFVFAFYILVAGVLLFLRPVNKKK